MAAFIRSVRVAIAERDALVAASLRYVLEHAPGIEVVARVADPALLQLDGARIAVVVLDIDGLSLDLESAIRACETGVPNARICVLTRRQAPDLMQRALAARASGFALADFAATSLPEIVHLLASGETYVDPRIAGDLLRRRSPRVREARVLSSRENEIMRLIAEGLSNRAIGTRLTLSEKTVKNHISHIFVKLDIKARSHAAVYAVRTGLVP